MLDVFTYEVQLVSNVPSELYGCVAQVTEECCAAISYCSANYGLVRARQDYDITADGRCTA